MSCCGGGQGHNHGGHDDGHNNGGFGSKMPLIIGAILIAGVLYYFLR